MTLLLYSQTDADPLFGRVMSEMGDELLSQIPVFLYHNHQFRAIMNVLGQQFQKLANYIDSIMRNLTPVEADFAMPLFERLVNLPIAPPGLDMEQRRALVLAGFMRVIATGSGIDWVSNMEKLLGSDFEYSEHVNGDPSTPPVHTVAIFIPFDGTSALSAYVEKFARSITPATIHINVTYSDGFILDVSQFDDDLL